MPAKKRKKAPPARVAPDRGDSILQVGAAALLVALAFLVYAPALGAGFIWDDGRAITNNPAFQPGHGLWDIWTGRGDADYFPLKTTLLWLLYQVFGAHTSPYHVFNVAIHAANAVLVWRVLRRLSIPGAFIAGLVFLVHPVHVESVAWVSECKNTLSTMFGLLALLAWFAYEDGRRPRAFAAALGLFVAGLLCKTSVVVLPLVMVLCAWWRQRPASMTNLARMSVFFVVACGFGAVTVWFQYGRAIGEYQLPVGGVPCRVANAGKATWWYLGKAFSPINPWYEMPGRPVETEPEARAVLAGMRPANPAPAWPTGKMTAWPLITIYPRWRVTSPVWYDFLPGLAMVTLFTLVAVGRNGRGRGAFFALSYFLVALLPVLGLLKMSYMRAAWVADHFQYLADIGVIAFVCAGGTLLWRRLPRHQRGFVAAAGGVLTFVLAMCTVLRAADYRDEYTLWTDTVAKNPDAWQAQNRLAAAMLARKEIRQAVEHLEQAVRLKPDDPDGHNNLGIALVSQGRLAEGIEQYRASLRLNDAQFMGHANLADALAGQKHYTDAIAEYRAAIRFNPLLASLHFRLAAALLDSGQLDDAITSLEKANMLAPNLPEITDALARARSRHDAAH